MLLKTHANDDEPDEEVNYAQDYIKVLWDTHGQEIANCFVQYRVLKVFFSRLNGSALRINVLAWLGFSRGLGFHRAYRGGRNYTEMSCSHNNCFVLIVRGSGDKFPN